MIYDLDTISADRKIETRRTVPYSPARVYEAFRDPEQLVEWWGPSGFSNTFDAFDFSEGGLWLFTMHGPDGKDYGNECRFVKLVEPSLVVLDHTVAPLFQSHYALKECPEGCSIDWSMVFEDAQTCSNIKNFVGDANEQNLDRLVAVLGGVI